MIIESFAQLTSILESMEKHIGVLNDDSIKMAASYAELSTAVAILTERVEWLVKFFWLVVGTSITALIVNIVSIFKKSK